MNILFLNSAKRGWGGNEKWTRMAATALQEHHGIFLAYRDERIGERFPVRRFRLPFLAEIDPATIAALVSIIRREKIDLLIPTKRKDYVLAGIASRLTGTANILRLGIDRPLQGGLIQQLVYGTMAEGIIVNAERIKRTLSRTPWLDPEKIAVIYNGLDRETLELEAREPYTKPYPFTIASAGALTSRKGFDFLIRAFARHCKERPGSQAGLVIAGEGEERPSLEALAASLGIAGKVRFEGFLRNPYPMMLAADLYVSASQSEGISNALIEAMALGCVPVTTRSGGAEESVRNGENGYLVDFGDEAALAAVISRLETDATLSEKMAHNAALQVARQFSMERMRDELASFCRSVIERKKHP